MNLLDKVTLLINVKLDEALKAGKSTPSVEKLKAQKMTELQQALAELEQLKQELTQLESSTTIQPSSVAEKKSAVVQNLETKLADLEELLGQLKDQAVARSQQADETLAVMNHPDLPESEIIEDDPKLAARKARLSA